MAFILNSNDQIHCLIKKKKDLKFKSEKLKYSFETQTTY